MVSEFTDMKLYSTVNRTSENEVKSKMTNEVQKKKHA